MRNKESDKNRKMSFRQLNYYITLLGSFFGFAIPQNKEFSENSHDPIPEDIRGNKKEGDEYDTIGDVLRKGGKRKTVLIAALILCLVLAIIYGVFFWGMFIGPILQIIG